MESKWFQRDFANWHVVVTKRDELPCLALLGALLVSIRNFKVGKAPCVRESQVGLVMYWVYRLRTLSGMPI